MEVLSELAMYDSYEVQLMVCLCVPFEISAALCLATVSPSISHPQPTQATDGIHARWSLIMCINFGSQLQQQRCKVEWGCIAGRVQGWLGFYLPRWILSQLVTGAAPIHFRYDVS